MVRSQVLPGGGPLWAALPLCGFVFVSVELCGRDIFITLSPPQLCGRDIIVTPGGYCPAASVVGGVLECTCSPLRACTRIFPPTHQPREKTGNIPVVRANRRRSWKRPCWQPGNAHGCHSIRFVRFAGREVTALPGPGSRPRGGHPLRLSKVVRSILNLLVEGGRGGGREHRGLLIGRGRASRASDWQRASIEGFVLADGEHRGLVIG
eukprot:7014578-Pyramimonas_sp.AAC.1